MDPFRSFFRLFYFAAFLGGASLAWSDDPPQLPEIDGLRLHLDAADTSALTVSDGQVEEWRDSTTANDITFSPLSGTNPPELHADVINGLPAVHFSGSSLDTRSPDALGITNDIAGITIFAVGWNRGGGAQTYTRIMQGTLPNHARVFFYRATNDHRFGGRRLDTDDFSNITTPTNTRLNEEWGIDTGVISYEHGSILLFINGELLADDGGFQDPGRTSPTDSTNFRIGSSARDPIDQEWDGYIAEFLIYDRVLSPAEFSAVGSYLAEKYALDWPELDLEVIDLSLEQTRQMQFDTVEGRDYIVLHTEDEGATWRRVTEDPIAGTGGPIALTPPASGSEASFRVVEWQHEEHNIGSGDPELPSVDGLRLHLDASDGDTVVRDGVSVVEWRNAADEEMVFFQDDSGHRPVYLDDIVNGRPALIFDGNHYLRTDSPAALGLTNDVEALTFFGVGWNRGGGAQNFMRISKGGDASVTAARAMFYRATNDHRVIGGRLDEAGTQTIIGTPRLSQEWGIDGRVLDFAGGEGYLYINGVEAGRSVNFLAGADEPGHTSPTDAHRFHLGSNTADSPGQFWDGDIAEMLLYDRALSQEERQAVGRYLSDRYGIPYSLTIESDIDFVVEGGISMEFSTELGNRYQLEWTDELGAPWVSWGGEIDGSGVNESVFVSFDEEVDRAFFRVRRVDD